MSLFHLFSGVPDIEKMEKKKDIKGLIKTLKDKQIDSKLRKAAIVALGRLNDQSAVEPINNVLIETDSDLVEAAISALGDLGDPRSIPLLLPIYENKNNLVSTRKKAIGAIGQIGGSNQEVETCLINAAKNDPEISIRVIAVRSIGNLNIRNAIPLLSEMLLDWLHYESLSDTGDSLRGPAAEALIRIADSQTIPLLIASIELDKLNLFPRDSIKRGESIRNGIESVDSDFSRSILEQYDMGNIDQDLVQKLLTAASDESRFSVFAPLVYHRQGGEIYEQNSFLFMVKQAKSLLSTIKQ